MIPFFDLYQQYLETKDAIDSSIAKVIASSKFLTGEMTEQFEDGIKNYAGAEACAAVGSGTDALVCSLMACGVGIGDEVITTPHTFISTSEAIVLVGAKPIYVDVDEYYHLDINKIEEKINKNTKAILFVDIYGQTPDVDKLRHIADKHSLYLIEDAAQSFGASYKNKKVGSLASDLTCMSFNPLKNLGSFGNAGAITGKKDLVALAKKHSDHGRDGRYDYQRIGINGRIDNIQAAVVLCKLQKLDEWLEKKRQICFSYNEVLKDKFIVPKEVPWGTHSFYVYALQVNERDKFISYMKENGVECNIHYPKSLTEQSFYSGQKCLNSESVCGRIVSLPCYHNLTKQNQEKIIELTLNWSL